MLNNLSQCWCAGYGFLCMPFVKDICHQTVASSICMYWKTNSTPLSSLITFKVAADGSQIPLAYRYAVQPGAKVNAFKAKELSQSDDKTILRSALFGALWCNKFTQLPRCAHCDVVWEARGSSTFFQKMGSNRCLRVNNRIVEMHFSRIPDTYIYIYIYIHICSAHRRVPYTNYYRASKKRWTSHHTCQVKIGEGVPCVITPLKPNFMLLGQLTIDAASAIKLK